MTKDEKRKFRERHRSTLPTITRQQIAELESSGHVVCEYKRLKTVSVGGFKQYRIV